MALQSDNNLEVRKALDAIVAGVEEDGFYSVLPPLVDRLWPHPSHVLHPGQIFSGGPSKFQSEKIQEFADEHELDYRRDAVTRALVFSKKGSEGLGKLAESLRRRD